MGERINREQYADFITLLRDTESTIFDVIGEEKGSQIESLKAERDCLKNRIDEMKVVISDMERNMKQLTEDKPKNLYDKLFLEKRTVLKPNLVLKVGIPSVFEKLDNEKPKKLPEYDQKEDICEYKKQIKQLDQLATQSRAIISQQTSIINSLIKKENNDIWMSWANELFKHTHGTYPMNLDPIQIRLSIEAKIQKKSKKFFNM